jgi:hypothetical protein
MDAMPRRLLERWCSDGSLPNLAALRGEGRYGGTSSLADVFPGSVWPSFFTRSHIADHGVYNLMQWDPQTLALRPPGEDWCPIEPFWRRLARTGIPVASLDAPFSNSGRDTANAVEVVGWSMHEGVWRQSHPSSVLKELRRRHRRPAQMREGPGERPVHEIVRELPGVLSDIPLRVSVIEDMARRYPWRVFVAVFSELHRAGHWFFSERGTGEEHGGLRRAAVAFDAVLPRVRALVDRETTWWSFRCTASSPHSTPTGLPNWSWPTSARRQLEAGPAVSTPLRS